MKTCLLPLLLLPFCALADEPKITYTCDNGSRVDISFLSDISGRPQATLQVADETIVLPRVPTGSGALYRNGDMRLHTKGDDAILEDGKGEMRRCTRGNTPPATAQAPQPTPPAAAASSFMEITGQVSYLTRIALPPGAILSIRIQAGGRTLADQRYELNGAQVPIPFTATVDRDLIGKKARLAVTARIDVDGKPRFVSNKVYPVMASQQPQPVDIILKSAGHARIR